jgi:hypothetical protein
MRRCSCLGTTGPRTYTRDGFPYPTDTPAFHATTALSAVLREGLKPRRDVKIHATGGGTDLAISLTLDQRVAEAICVGLNVLSHAARYEITIREVCERVKDICPKGMTKALKHVTEEEHAPATMKSIDMLDAGYRYWQKYWPNTQPLPGAIQMHPNNDRDWWVPAANHESDYIRKHTNNEPFAQFYKTLLHFGEAANECYNPLFFLTSMEALAKVKPSQIGFVETRVNIPRICLDGFLAWKLGYLSKDAARSFERFLQDDSYKCSSGVEDNAEHPEEHHTSHKMYLQPYHMENWEVIDEGERLPNQTMPYLSSMAEIRVYDPKAITIVGSATMNEIYDARGEMLVYPYFEAAAPNLAEKL